MISDNYGVENIEALEGIEAIRLSTDGLIPLKCPHCKQSMRLVSGYLIFTYWFCENCKKEYEFDGNLEHITDEVSAAADNHFNASGISKICNGIRNKCGGFKWKY